MGREEKTITVGDVIAEDILKALNYGNQQIDASVLATACKEKLGLQSSLELISQFLKADTDYRLAKSLESLDKYYKKEVAKKSLSDNDGRIMGEVSHRIRFVIIQETEKVKQTIKKKVGQFKEEILHPPLSESCADICKKRFGMEADVENIENYLETYKNLGTSQCGDIDSMYEDWFMEAKSRLSIKDLGIMEAVTDILKDDRNQQITKIKIEDSIVNLLPKEKVVVFSQVATAIASICEKKLGLRYSKLEAIKEYITFKVTQPQKSSKKVKKLLGTKELAGAYSQDREAYILDMVAKIIKEILSRKNKTLVSN